MSTDTASSDAITAAIAPLAADIAKIHDMMLQVTNDARRLNTDNQRIRADIAALRTTMPSPSPTATTFSVAPLTAPSHAGWPPPLNPNPGPPSFAPQPTSLPAGPSLGATGSPPSFVGQPPGHHHSRGHPQQPRAGLSPNAAAYPPDFAGLRPFPNPNGEQLFPGLPPQGFAGVPYTAPITTIPRCSFPQPYHGSPFVHHTVAGPVGNPTGPGTFVATNPPTTAEPQFGQIAHTQQTLNCVAIGNPNAAAVPQAATFTGPQPLLTATPDPRFTGRKFAFTDPLQGEPFPESSCQPPFAESLHPLGFHPNPAPFRLPPPQFIAREVPPDDVLVPAATNKNEENTPKEFQVFDQPEEDTNLAQDMENSDEEGVAVRSDGKLMGTQSLKSFLGEEKLKECINFILPYIADLGIPIKMETFIDFRSGMLNVSPIGRNYHQEERGTRALLVNLVFDPGIWLNEEVIWSVRVVSRAMGLFVFDPGGGCVR